MGAWCSAITTTILTIAMTVNALPDKLPIPPAVSSFSFQFKILSKACVYWTDQNLETIRLLIFVLSSSTNVLRSITALLVLSLERTCIIVCWATCQLHRSAKSVITIGKSDLPLKPCFRGKLALPTCTCVAHVHVQVAWMLAIFSYCSYYFQLLSESEPQSKLLRNLY